MFWLTLTPQSPEGEACPAKSTNGEMSCQVHWVLLGLPGRNGMKAGMTGVRQGRVFPPACQLQIAQSQSILPQGALLSAGWHYPPFHLPFRSYLSHR